MSPKKYSEDALVEQPALELLGELGWEVVDAFSEKLGAAGTLGRDSFRDVILHHRLHDAIVNLNPGLPQAVVIEAVEVMTKDRSLMDRTRANREVYDLLRDGFKTSWADAAGTDHDVTVRFVDFRDSEKNDWLAASQVWVQGELHRRRTDTILFVNGIPLVLCEFKEPNRPAKSGYDENITDYRDVIPDLFVPNAFVLVSNASEAKVGATFASWEFFGDWKVIDADGSRGVVALETALRGTCAPDRLLDIVENFIAYLEQPRGLVKRVARNHQVLGVNAAFENLYAVRERGDKRLGVYWHTQGSGKSLSMLWFTQKVLRLVTGSWTFVMVTDRTDLDDQLHDEFADAGAVSKEARIQADSSSHLRELLRADHRYVFTLIQKFRMRDGEREMPVLSDRDDVIVITDEAHRSQYDTLALNMRAALPHASFMGFTGTPLMKGEEATRKEFGDYVSIYNFSDAIKDGATVPLYYENRIPELQLINEDFADDLATILEDAEVDDDDEGRLVQRFARQYALITRPERLKVVARDLVEHFVGRGFTGKAMYVGVDKAAAVRMFNLVQTEWRAYRAELVAQHDALPELERQWLASRIALMQTTDMAVVVSQGQNEVGELARQGLDIKPHRTRMINEEMDEKFKDPDDPLRIVFVCAMWMTGFDAPSVSTIYLDRPMRNHTLMQTIARANRVFPEKESGLIVDYIGVFRDLEKALAVYGAANEGAVDSPIQDKTELVAALATSVADVADLCARYDVDLDALQAASGFAFTNLKHAAAEALWVDVDVLAEFLAKAQETRKLFKAILPHVSAATYQSTVAVIRVLAEYILSKARPDTAGLQPIADAVDALLDRSVGAEEYVIRAAADDAADPVIDLSKIDFEELSRRLAGRKRAETNHLAAALKQRATAAARVNPTRLDLVRRIEELIRDYNAGSVNIDEYLRRLIDISKDLSAEEQRAVTEDMTEEELAIFDLLTRPEPVLDAAERAIVKASAKKLFEHVQDKLVLDWRRKADAAALVKTTIRELLDNDLPADPYPPEMFDTKVQAIFDYLVSSPSPDRLN